MTGSGQATGRGPLLLPEVKPMTRRDVIYGPLTAITALGVTSFPAVAWAANGAESGANVAGEALGQGVQDEWGSWYLLDPDGRKVERLLDPR